MGIGIGAGFLTVGGIILWKLVTFLYDYEALVTYYPVLLLPTVDFALLEHVYFIEE